MDSPDPPKYFAMMKKLNKVGPAILGGIPRPARYTLAQFDNAVKENITIIDTRNKLSFAGGHVPGSINIQDNSAFSTWAGWILDYEKPFVLVAHDHRIEELTKQLIRIGLDNIAGYLSDIDGWANAGHELETVNQITCSDLQNRLNENNIQVLDVRGYAEFNAGHLQNAINIHVGYLFDNLDTIPKDKDVVVHCVSGDRSSIAASLLLSKGFKNVINLTGGYSNWANNGFKIEREENLVVA